MSITLRFALTLGGLLLGLTVALLCQRWFEFQGNAREKLLFQKEQTAFLSHWLKADNETLLAEVRSSARQIATQQSQPFTKFPLTASRTLWKLNPEGVLIDLHPGLISPSEVPLFTVGEFIRLALRPEGGWFYFKANGEFFQSSYTPIEATGGWLFLIRKWDTPLLQKLGSLVDGTAILADHSPSSPASNDRYQLSQELLDWRGQHLQTLTVRIPYPQDITYWALSGRPTVIFVSFGLLLIITLALGLHNWVITPLNHIKASLTSGQLEPVSPYLERPDEIGRLARLIEDHHKQRNALHQSEIQLGNALEERIRLGRDLHDGVIQSLYATGMVLAGLQSRVPLEDQATRHHLDQSRTTLNQVIIELRNFITGLEPDSTTHPSFDRAVADLLKFAEAGSDVKTTCLIDDNLADQLTITQRAHLLQITREALSNALRHGQATVVSAQLQANGSTLEYHFRDNGRGFTPDSPEHSGHGLENLAQRARDLGATLSVDSQPGQGTHLKLQFELPHPEQL